MKKVEVFDPPMCCSSGVCGPKVDKKLVAFSAALEWLRSKGVEVMRYNPTQQYEVFISNAKVSQAVNNGGTSCLPLILVNDEIVSQGGYPARDALVALVDVGKE